MPSTVIKRFVYIPERRELVVEFVTGRRYAYADVPEEEVAQFRAAFSKGSHFNRHIRDRYACRELARVGGEDG
jgi:lysyl-tRNA synthetase class 2